MSLAREVDAAYAEGKTAPDDLVARLAQAVLDFQNEISGSNGESKSRQKPQPTH